MLNVSSRTLQVQQDTVLGLLTTHDNLGGNEIRAVLGCTASDLQAVMTELIARGLVQTDSLRNAVRYSKRTFEHDPSLVHAEWFARLEAWFAGGKTETVFSLSRHMALRLPDLRATLEEMRKRGMLYGKFVGNMCVYSLRERGVVLHSTPGPSKA